MIFETENKRFKWLVNVMGKKHLLIALKKMLHSQTSASKSIDTCIVINGTQGKSSFI